MPTDKERLDWMLKPGHKCVYFLGRWVASWAKGWAVERDYPRAAIDAAMKAERTRKKEVGR